MRKVITALGVLALTACGSLEPEEIADCERYVQGKLRSPSTYKRVSARSTLMKDEKPAQRWVSVEYDAANVYGTPIRDTQICKYPYKPGLGADLSKYINHDDALLNELSGPEAVAGTSDQANRIIAEAEAAAKKMVADERKRENEKRLREVAAEREREAESTAADIAFGEKSSDEAVNENEVDGQPVTQAGDNWVNANGTVMAPRGD